jgi:hypothetical protein
MTHIFRTVSCFIFIFVICGVTAAQTPSPSPAPAPPPANDIYLIDVLYKNLQPIPLLPVKITEWNGYNNQPFFLPDGHGLLYTSIRADKQADIYRYEFKSGKTSRVTETAESEYSPTVTPDKKFISVVRVEADSTQRLWKFPLGGGAPVLVLEKIKPVGYHAWLHQNTLALFILGASGKPNTLQLVNTGKEDAEVIAENIGRPLRLIPNQNKLSFVHKISKDDWTVEAFDLKTRQTTTLIKTLPGSEDFVWTPKGMLLMGKDSKLYAWDPAKDSGWREIADFSQAGLKGITRIAISAKGDRIAIVARRETP